MTKDFISQNRRAFAPFWGLSFFFIAIGMWQYPFLFNTNQAGLIFDELTNFWYSSRYLSLWDSLRETDAGYLPLLPRIISVVAEQLVPDSAIPAAYHFVSLVISAFCLSSFTLPYFRGLVPSDFARIWVCLFLRGIDPAGGHFAGLYNLPYFAMVPGFLIVCMQDVISMRSPKVQFSLGLFLALLMLTKPLFFIFLPLLVAFALRDVSRKRVPPLAFLIPTFLGAALQLIITISNKRFMTPNISGPLILQVWTALSMEMRLLSQWLLALSLPDRLIPWSTLGILIISFLHFATIRKRFQSVLDLLFSPWALALISVTFFAAILAQTYSWVEFGEFPILPKHQSNAGRFVAMTGFCIALYQGLSKKWAHIFMGLLTVLSLMAALPEYESSIKRLRESAKVNNWRTLRQLNEKESFCIPLVSRETSQNLIDLDFVATRECQVVVESHSQRAFTLPPASGWMVPALIRDRVVNWILFRFEQGSDPLLPELQALDGQGQTLLTVKALQPTLGRIAIFHFPGGVKGVQRIRFFPELKENQRIETNSELGTPTWAWAFREPTRYEPDQAKRRFYQSTVVSTFVDFENERRKSWAGSLASRLQFLREDSEKPASVVSVRTSVSGAGAPVGVARLPLDFSEFKRDFKSKNGNIQNVRLTVTARAEHEHQKFRVRVIQDQGPLAEQVFLATAFFQAYSLDITLSGEPKEREMGSFEVESDLDEKGRAVFIQNLRLERR